MKYTELKAKHSAEVNNFPMAFSFSDDQLVKALKKLNVKRENMEAELMGLDGGGMIRKTDVEAFDNMFARHRTERAEAFKDDEFLINAINYELGNHEFMITYDPQPTIDALGIDIKDERVLKCFCIARKKYLEWQEEHGCFA